ncbi:hypothetical protein Poli38472_007823 [Pythium oligandrum]|uniref:Uncharacterized protein n=1 Tax=Pythium oligandrum TaxID=41045 RepID=A0A8K1CQU9_PYTOL|nr:hypothetical protein Poli38472_007823 [Pythium oligandrum]|eukprot:TMW68151.1 hypothetical protein Poli38472_007823 [Pythium oligandrum]
MSLSVSRESISTLMTELVDSFPMESDGRSSISDFGKLLFAEGQNAAVAVKTEEGQDDEADDDDDDEDDDEDDEAVDDEPTPSGAQTSGTKRVFTEIKGVPRQKHHDVQCVVTETGKIAISQGSMHKLMKSKEKAVPKRWTQEEDDRLRAAVGKHGERNWKSIAEEVPGRNHTQCLQRWTKVLAPGLVKGHWRPDEDELLKELVAEGRKNWGQVANRIPGRTSKQCRERWYNHLDPSIVRGEYTPEEDRIILEAQARLGNKWSTIAAMLPGRTEDAVKIRWKSLCRVRKGQNRRVQQEKSKANGKPMMPSGFDGNMIKSEELGSFGQMQTQPTPMGRVPVNAPHMMPHQQMQMAGGAPGMMYPQGSYHPSMGGQYQKAQVPMHAVNAYGQPMIGGSSSDMNMDRRANVVNISSPSTGMYQPVYATPGPHYGVVTTSTDAHGNVYSHGPMPGYVAAGGVYRVPAPGQVMAHGQPGAAYYGMNAVPAQQMGMPSHDPNGVHYSQQQYPPHYSAHVSPAQQQHLGQQTSSAPPTPNPAESHHQQEGQPTNDQPPTATPQNSGLKPGVSPAAAFVKSLDQSGTKPATPNLAANFAQSLNPAKAPGGASPAAMFAQNLAAKNPSTSSPAAAFAQSQNPRAAAGSATPPNPAAMFAQTLASNKATPGSQPVPKPFNPAMAFAQRLQTTGQKPPMPSTSSTASVKSGEEEDTLTDEDGDEPSLKKVRPRNSIDMAARASAARRMRTSGTGGALMGRRSLDVFLNEIGDVGRISDLKMDEFQTIEELWRVSGDMDRLSL